MKKYFKLCSPFLADLPKTRAMLALKRTIDGLWRDIC